MDVQGFSIPIAYISKKQEINEIPIKRIKVQCDISTTYKYIPHLYVVEINVFIWKDAY